jgi:hypothetical protein
MRKKVTSVSLYEGSTSKVFSAEVTNSLGMPVKNVEVVFSLDGEGSLAADIRVSTVVGRTDGLGCAAISFNRMDGPHGRVEASLTAACPFDVDAIRLRLVSVTA